VKDTVAKLLQEGLTDVQIGPARKLHHHLSFVVRTKTVNQNCRIASKSSGLRVHTQLLHQSCFC